MTDLLAQLAFSPLYIITVLMAFRVIVFLRKEKGFIHYLCKIWAVIHILIYLLAIYFSS
ncbi:hypothetical protein [Niallia sp. 03133]|uniref:hypothetical protein n=1 Tax=Niallia sp. 03133 TaxID=3458060 RepID=UPI004043F39A